MMETVDSEFITSHANTLFFSLGNQLNPHSPTLSPIFPLIPTLQKKISVFPSLTHSFLHLHKTTISHILKIFTIYLIVCVNNLIAIISSFNLSDVMKQFYFFLFFIIFIIFHYFLFFIFYFYFLFFIFYFFTFLYLFLCLFSFFLLFFLFFIFKILKF